MSAIKLYYGNWRVPSSLKMQSEKAKHGAVGNTDGHVKSAKSAIRSAIHFIAWGIIAAMCVIGAAVVVLVPNPDPVILVKGVASGAVAVGLLLALEKIFE